jgi:preprotein translocase subunit SecG
MLILLQILFLLIALMLCFIILVQPAKGDGIASAFAGVGSESFFGTKAHQSMSRITIVLSVLVLALGIIINMIRAADLAPPSPDAKTETPAKERE